MFHRILIGALGGAAAAISKVLAIDSKVLAALLNAEEFAKAADLKVTIFIHTPLLIALGAMVAFMTNETVRMKLFAIGVSAPALVAPWLSQPAKFIDLQAAPDRRAAQIDFLFPRAYAGDEAPAGGVTQLDALGYILGLPTNAPEGTTKFWVIVGSHKELDDAKAQVDAIRQKNPQIQPFVGVRKPGNDYYPVIVGGTTAFLPLDKAMALKKLAESSPGVAPDGAYLSDYSGRLPNPAVAQ